MLLRDRLVEQASSKPGLETRGRASRRGRLVEEIRVAQSYLVPQGLEAEPTSLVETRPLERVASVVTVDEVWFTNRLGKNLSLA